MWFEIITKALVIRHSSVMEPIISRVQSVAVRGRNIQDNTLSANKLVDSHIREKKVGLLMKLDFYKAFYCVSWRYLDYILDRCGFGLKWRAWIHACISMTHFSIIINGSPREHFPSTIELRQGDLISPQLFVIVTEGLSHMLFRAKDMVLIKGLFVKPESEEVIVLQFADDTLILMEDDIDMVKNLKGITLWFGIVLGLQINSSKCKVIPINQSGVPVQIKGLWACKLEALPSTYGRGPMGVKYKCKQVWNELFERFRTRLSL